MRYIVSEPLDLTALAARVGGPAHGAICTFSGVVRAVNEGLQVAAITYEAYSEMAEAEMARVAAEVSERWPDVALAMQHRIGFLAVGETSIAIAAAAPHRAEAFDACRFALDEAKRRVPIWKKEHAQDGAGRWVDGVLPERK